MAKYTLIAAIMLVLAVQISLAVWWIPQKWHACTRLYDNQLAQIICFAHK